MKTEEMFGACDTSKLHITPQQAFNNIVGPCNAALLDARDRIVMNKSLAIIRQLISSVADVAAAVSDCEAKSDNEGDKVEPKLKLARPPIVAADPPLECVEPVEETTKEDTDSEDTEDVVETTSAE